MARRHRSIWFLAGFLLSAGLSLAYTQWGSWDLPTPWTFTAPRPVWARVLLAPGVAVAHACYDGFLRHIFSFRAALWVAGGVGVLTMGLLGGGASQTIACLRRT